MEHVARRQGDINTRNNRKLYQKMKEMNEEPEHSISVRPDFQDKKGDDSDNDEFFKGAVVRSDRGLPAGECSLYFNRRFFNIENSSRMGFDVFSNSLHT